MSEIIRKINDGVTWSIDGGVGRYIGGELGIGAVGVVEFCYGEEVVLEVRWEVYSSYVKQYL